MAGRPKIRARYEAKLAAALKAAGEPVPMGTAQALAALVTEPAQAETFEAELVRVLREHGGVSTEATWEYLAEAVAAHFLKIKGQSPLSTFNMLTQAGRMVLLIRMASRKSHGAERAQELAEFQALMASVFADDRRDPVAVALPRSQESDDEEEDEDEEE